MTVKAKYRRCGAATALAALIALAVLPQASWAAEPAPDSVVARVNGAEITEADLAQAALDFRDQISQMPEDQRRGQLIQHLIDTKLSARAAEAEGLDKKPDVQRRLETVRDRTLQLEYVRAKVLSQVTDEMLHKRYDELVKSFVPSEQYHASHILVKTEDEAKAIIAELNKGGDFAAIAKEKSIDPGSGAKGGDLGFFDPAQMVKPFEDAVEALEGRRVHQDAGPVAVRLARHQAGGEAQGSRRRPSRRWPSRSASRMISRALRQGDAGHARQRHRSRSSRRAGARQARCT